jgi:hypothetical protein
MNRHERRAAKSKSRTTGHRIVAIHEAGHACGRVLAAPAFELSPADMIDSIVIGSGQVIGRSHMSRSTLLISQAVTYGPLLSAAMRTAVDERNVPGSTLTYQHIARLLTIARGEGLNVDEWLRGQLLQIAMGSAAEAKYTGASVETVWDSYASEGDRKDAIRACELCAGLAPAEAQSLIGQALKRAEMLVEKVGVYRAILLLADKLPIAGRMSGRQAARIFMGAMGGTTVGCEETGLLPMRSALPGAAE